MIIGPAILGRHEVRPVAERLVARVLDQLAATATVLAFDFASALSLRLEALPVRHRPINRQEREGARFTGEDLQRYPRRSATSRP